MGDGNKIKNMLKIVYFDEISATDYLIIKKEGFEEIITKELTSDNQDLNSTIESSLWAKLPLWLLGIGGGVKAEGKIKFGTNENNIIKKTISNSLLSDFIKEIHKDEKIKKFEGFSVNPYPNSMTFVKMFTPYLKMFKNGVDLGNITLNFSDIDDVFEDGKGYYELVAFDDKKKFIFRFNINSFRNNYTIADLTKMNLTYFGIKVGEIDEIKLDISTELNMDFGDDVQLEDIEGGVKQESKLLSIYDIILAGVDDNEN